MKGIALFVAVLGVSSLYQSVEAAPRRGAAQPPQISQPRIPTAALPTLQSIKAMNDALHQKSIRKGLFVGFTCTSSSCTAIKPVSKPVTLAEVGAMVGRQPLTMHVVSYEKLSNWWLVPVTLLGGSYPSLEDVNLKELRKVGSFPVNSVGDIAARLQEAELLAPAR